MTIAPSIRLHDLIDVVDAVHPEPLQRLSGAMQVAEELGETADALVGHYVDQARRSGATWSQIGASMGVSKQAAQKRFVSGGAQPAAASATAAADQGFHRFTDDARAVVVDSQRLAHEGHHDKITLSHLVLALLRNGDSPVARLVAATGVDVAEVVRITVTQLPERAEHVPALVPFDERCKQALERSFAEAGRLGEEVVDAPHVLLAVLAVEDGTGALAGLGLREQAVVEALHPAG
ncbi:Clp amino terminal domain-containing protein, pathogenicity island component [Quadrisphaera granulorum]|uniref:ClpA/ClpB-like protein n=1 Tax=Quadrisphaera granulorum TaxID=317664 RepID=A0A315ZNG0_9ACTN|nr:Clp protease N-terminal domain-containing protein [Quadrisphaera granulorum]PWJ47111.1 ClpA/ClpB-like protein [Quadrisphaera granulorum]SZE98915.1 Clp amino terminal domain-containing protein, pathogenicity island component [Quadrisphaera granulorum]